MSLWPPAQGLAMSSNVTADSSASASDFAPETKRRKVSHATYLTWKRDLDRDFSTNKRSLLSNDTLDDLLLMAIDGVPIAEFNPDPAIDCWWKDKQRNPYKQTTDHTTPLASNDSTNTDSDIAKDLLTE